MVGLSEMTNPVSALGCVSWPCWPVRHQSNFLPARGQDRGLELFALNTLQDLIDSDELLDAEDLKKPDPASLRAASCGEGKKRKACKNW